MKDEEIIECKVNAEGVFEPKVKSENARAFPFGVPSQRKAKKKKMPKAKKVVYQSSPGVRNNFDDFKMGMEAGFEVIENIADGFKRIEKALKR